MLEDSLFILRYYVTIASFIIVRIRTPLNLNIVFLQKPDYDEVEDDNSMATLKVGISSLCNLRLSTRQDDHDSFFSNQATV